ncbi:hypothetical protein AB4455_14335 [Vibrio sp. 10N.261.46.E12]|uniref:hypothetical protein n=1 Tax=unclassified Vibrio TaxID=2614977 RepID=UPI0009775803|nr:MULTISPECIES: hypothetical protein [unclassified Vibrio]OMO37211.1 hypothetical protein BH584_23450 [Vibrio sp. 10N.261.45.E1]PMJ20535.1 hypothetical protein BCU27_19465 [Vibrio sp. 10N.286.45.B6]PML83460.1 hypothetical protein BCT66_19195 [Vibrio sp. 10N.261.49.E11]PMM78600.1 hypothetical protein BCT48_22780 [Vibrio sp. 10N.261.46.F12]PMM89623.1 hypothetical protein BCT46_04360 [Vibrio sp. 10N.261.46.E8]
MLKKTILAGLVVSVMAGCSSIPGMESATVDREATSKELTQNCKELGTEFTPVSFAVDKASTVMVSLQERQCSVFNDYRTLASKHGDVAGFLAVNADKSDEELRAAMKEFDEGKPDHKKITPQVEAYKKASDEIFQKNLKLATDIAVQAAELTYIASQHASALAHDSAGGAMDSFFAAVSSEKEGEASEEETVPVVEAYHEMEARSILALDANSLISMDKNTIEQLENLDKVVADKVKS